MAQDSPAALANSKIPFPVACRWAGIDVPSDPAEGGIKIYCPFGEWAHDDGGSSPAFRVYADHGWCFACGQYFSPVRICADVWDMAPDEAARQMLERAGIADPDYKQQWQRLVDWCQPPDLDGMAAALRAWCARADPDWKARQYDSAVSAKLAACLVLLGRVRTEQDCRAWLAGCKKAMGQVLGKGDRR